jgi:OOP family OmpA-OmpF porin
MKASRLKAVRWASVVAASALLAVAPGAGAQQRTTPAADNWGTYAGASIGDTDFDLGLKVFVGQQFHPYLAWEAQFIHFGEEDFRIGGLNVKRSASALGGSIVGLLPVSPNVDLFGKLGAHYVRVRSRGGASGSDSDFDLGIGAGVRFRINPQVSLRLEVEDIGDGGDVISVGVQWRF